MASSSSYSYSVPPSSSFPQCNYDVFLSFRGEDTRKTFVDHLYTALKARQIHVYRDDEALPRGESIAPALFKAIEGSQIAVIIFSKNYANSSWCLKELTHIVKCQRERNLIVLPIFYGVDPSDVRKQKGTFGEAFAKHEREGNKVESWRKALIDASQIAGWDPQNIANGHESKAINEIADDISYKLFSLISDVDEGFVGMRVRLHELEEHLQIGSGGVRMVGIWGIGGGGKTTLANYLCMKISNCFEGYCIVNNIREESTKHGLKALQKKLLSRFTKTKMELQSIEEGKFSIRKRLRCSNVLIILDDVDHIDQLEALAGSESWFGSGSRILITTRNKQLLVAHRVHQVYPIKLLTNEEAIQLFNKKAYNDKVIQDYETLSSSVVSYADGLPLALKVLGSFLNGQDEKVWRDTLDRLKNTSELEIVEKLKISYDGLQNDEKELFLDIACFFRGSSIKIDDDAIEKLEACGYHLDRGIQVLKQKALINIDKHVRFDMHDLVEEMAHYIVRGEHPNNPQKHSRVWKHEEIINLYLGDATMENDKIEMLNFDFDFYFGNQSSLCKFLSKMKKLRVLEVKYCYYGDVDDEDFEGPDFLSSELRYIYCRGHSTSQFPDSFQPMKLVVLKLYESLQKELWKGCKHLPHLKVLYLKDMKNLVKIPRFDELPCLQKLTLENCDELEKIHPSLGNHRCIQYINISNCRKLEMFPTITKMEKLTTLKIKGFGDQYLEFPEIKSNMESLETLYLNYIGIDALLSSIGERCPNLTSLYLEVCFYLKIREVNFNGLKHLKELKLESLKYLTMTQYNDRFHLESWYGLQHPTWLWPMFPQMASSLQKLNLSRCGLRDGEIPSIVGELSNLIELDLYWNDFTRLHFSLLQLTRLKYLNLSLCTQLIELPELPSGIVWLKANNCRSLTTIGNIHSNCKHICQVLIKTGKWSKKRGTIIAGGKLLLESMLQGNATKNYPMVLKVDGLDIPKSFLPPLLRGGKYKLVVPENWCSDFCGFLICVVLGDNHDEFPEISMYSKQGVNNAHDVVWEESNDDKATFVLYVPFSSLIDTEWWDESHKEVWFSLDRSSSFYKEGYNGVGVRLVARKSGSGQREKLTTQQQQSEISPYLPQLDVYDESADRLSITLR